MNILPAKLTHPEYGSCAELEREKIVFSNQVLEGKVNTFGIMIPYYMQENFEGKKIIYPYDNQFVRAFVEVYYPFYLKEQGYKLESLDGTDKKNL